MNLYSYLCLILDLGRLKVKNLTEFSCILVDLKTNFLLSHSQAFKLPWSEASLIKANILKEFSLYFYDFVHLDCLQLNTFCSKHFSFDFHLKFGFLIFALIVLISNDYFYLIVIKFSCQIQSPLGISMNFVCIYFSMAHFPSCSFKPYYSQLHMTWSLILMY